MLCLTAAGLSALILLLTTLRETISREQIVFLKSTLENYETTKGWAFWLQVAVTVIDIIIVILCAVENNKLNKLQLILSAYAQNPSPNSLAQIDYSCTSEYFNPYFSSVYNNPSTIDPISTISDKAFDGWAQCNSPHCQLESRNFPNPLHFCSSSFSNPAFLDENHEIRDFRK